MRDRRVMLPKTLHNAMMYDECIEESEVNVNLYICASFLLTNPMSRDVFQRDTART